MRGNKFLALILVGAFFVLGKHSISFSGQLTLKAPWKGKAIITQGNNGDVSHNVCGKRSLDNYCTTTECCAWENTYAIDIALKEGTEVLAPVDGEVEYIDEDPKELGGRELAIKHIGSDGEEFVTVYLHLKEIITKKGKVKQGQVIAKSGSSSNGDGGTRPHLHFHIWKGQGRYDSHTQPFERLILKRVNVDAVFKIYGTAGKSLNDLEIRGKEFESNNVQLNSLARIENQPEVYWLQNRKVYHVLSEKIIQDMSILPGWGKDKINVYPADVLDIRPPGALPIVDTFEQGPDFIAPNSQSEGLLISLYGEATEEQRKVYVIEDGKRRWITTAEIFNQLGYDWNNIIEVAPSFFNKESKIYIPEGDPIKGKSDLQVSTDKLAYSAGDIVSGNLKIDYQGTGKAIDFYVALLLPNNKLLFLKEVFGTFAEKITPTLKDFILPTGTKWSGLIFNLPLQDFKNLFQSKFQLENNGGTQAHQEIEVPTGQYKLYSVFTLSDSDPTNTKHWLLSAFSSFRVSTLISTEGEAPWPMPGHDLQRTGRSDFIGAQTNNVKWFYYIENDTNQEPLIDSNGTIYIIERSVFKSRYLHAINPDGSLKWKYEVEAYKEEELEKNFDYPIIGLDGRVYLFGILENGRIMMLIIDSEGKSEIKELVEGFPRGAVIGTDGTIYLTISPFNKSEDELYALALDGTFKWKYSGIDFRRAPVIGLDGTVYCSIGDKLAAITSNGTLKWISNIRPYSPFSCLGCLANIGPDGTIYVASEKYLYALSSDGVIKWKYEYYHYISQQVAIDQNGTIYFAGDAPPASEDRIYSLNPNGTLKWSYDIDNSSLNDFSIIIGGDGTIYFGRVRTQAGYHDTDVYALNPDGTSKWKFVIENVEKIESYMAKLAIGLDNTLYCLVRSYEEDKRKHYSVLYAFGP